MDLFDVVNELQRAVTRANAMISRIQWAADHSYVAGTVTDVDPKKHRCRIAIGEGADGKEVKSPWIPYSQIAGTRKVHSAPSKGQQMTLFAPNGDYSQAMVFPYTWSDNNPSPSEKGDEDIDLRGKSRRTQKDADVKQEVDGLTVQHTKQSTTITVHKDPANQQEGQGEEVSDKKPWKGNRAKAKHKRTINKDAGYSLTINDGDEDNVHKVIVHPDGKIEHSIKGGKHKVTIDGDKIEASWDKGKHTSTLRDGGINHSVDGGAQEVQINSMSGGLGSMAGGQLPSLLGGENMGALQNQLRSLLSSGALSGILGGGGGGLGGLLGGQLGTILPPELLTQLGSQLTSALGNGSLGGMLQPGIVHKSSSTVKIESPQIEHQGNLMVMGSLMATKTVQAPGFLGNLQGIASGIGFGGGLTPPTTW